MNILFEEIKLLVFCNCSKQNLRGFGPLWQRMVKKKAFKHCSRTLRSQKWTMQITYAFEARGADRLVANSWYDLA